MCVKCSHRKKILFSDSMVIKMIVFKAINGPLQDRGNVLDLDYNRANTFPADYDTDLESEWVNESKLTPCFLVIH